MLARKKVLGDYQVGKTIGQGAFSKVKLGFHKETGQKVAIKIIDKKQAAAKAEKAKKAQDDIDRKQKAEEARRPTSRAERPKERQRVPDPRGEPIDETGSSPDTGRVGETDDGSLAEEAKTPPPFVSQLQLEVQLLMRLDHPNVIRLYQVMETEEECFVVMEYAQGGELIEYIAPRGHLSEKEARRYFRQIVSAMDHCHMANVVHRDLKLENLLLNGERNILISDFGLGRTFRSDSEELMKTFCGTPNYAAVELISGIPYVGVKSDIWAMGVVLYVMMTGRPPFIGENISALYSKIKAVDYKCPDYFSQGLRNLLAKILVKDPKRRIDMDGIREDPWINYEEIERPMRLLPKVMGSADASQISQFISGITYDQTFVIYTFRRHTRDGTSVYGANGHANITQAQKRELKRRKSLTVQMAPNGGSGTKVSPTSAIAQSAVPEEDNGDNLAELPGYTSPPAAPARMRTLPALRNRRMSLDSAPPPGAPPQGDMAMSREGPDAASNFTGFPRRQRRNTATAILQPGDGQESGSPELTSSRARSVSATPEGGFAASRNKRRGSIGVPGIPDRESNIMRRMSMVGPAGETEGSEPQSTFTPPRRASFLSPVQSSPQSTLRSPRTSSADDPDPMLFNDPISPVNFPVESDDEEQDVTTVEPSRKEIEDWHLLHRPPKTIRTVRFAFHSATTSTQAPSAIFQEVHRVLLLIRRHHDERLTFTRVEDFYMLNCKLTEPNPDDNVEFEIEVCKVWLLKMHGVRIKRLSGNPFIFKEIYSNFVAMLQL
ncbi:CAMK/CAMKL protein kinase [Spizellomyces punctatus DAOM BR117]|uniref:non-specific serine/threonine protein kinase n=1 Tax=Spizellomyces punctatus (strain DAOM BR117) TaxID=645134 RepID=A0A0L0HTH7_SPIPD|nr:CAMK/CAMKL protein kinase [Spizellomyces punctatus DAOM BR117]KND04169.1 CAMK/CAMKL protein kinase [Spizellomyces punctatus DAOM BR117]|eukprot:XP_016612208.1 CAMK/CAMKL protein kinase [Spizellomyces punctatus DAOM BR117]